MPGARLDPIFEWLHILVPGKRASGHTALHPTGCYFWSLAGIRANQFQLRPWHPIQTEQTPSEVAGTFEHQPH